MNQPTAISTLPATLVAPSASVSLAFPLIQSGKREAVNFGDLYVEYAYDAIQIDDLCTEGMCMGTMNLVVICRTVISANEYTAKAVCAFAENALRQALGAGAVLETSVDEARCRVACMVKCQGSGVNALAMLRIATYILNEYATSFSGAANINPPTEPRRIPLPEEEEGIGGNPSD